MMSPRSRRTAGLILLFYPTALLGGLLVLMLLRDPATGAKNPLADDFFPVAYAHAIVLLILALVLLQYVDDALLSDRTKHLVRLAAPTAAVLTAAGFILAVVPLRDGSVNGFINLVYLGTAVLVAGLIALGVGMIRN